MKERWTRVGSRAVFSSPIFDLREDHYEFSGQPTHPYYVLAAPPWVNVVAVTKDDRIVLVRQFRHGIREDSLEIPGGIVDTADTDPKRAGARELLEESGYAGDPPELLLCVTSNPAILNNRTYSYLIRNARRVGEPTPDAFEDIEVVLEPRHQIADLIRSGRIHHSLSVAALFGYLASYSMG